MGTLHLHATIPTDLADFVLRQVSDGGFTAVDDYVAELIRRELATQGAVERLVLDEHEGLILEATAGPMTPLLGADFDAVREAVRAQGRGVAS